MTNKELWLGKLDFFLSVMGFNIGLGNLLRFPYLCARNGGGAFLIPYFILLLTMGVPLFLIEMALGQYSGKTPLVFWGNIAPAFKGIGWCNVFACGMYNIYYTVLMAWIIFYLIASCFPDLGWSSCKHSWSSSCCYKESESNISILQFRQERNCAHSPSFEFWENRALQISKGITDVGYMKWDIALCLVVAWALVYICLIRGIRSMGKVVYVTALAPYILLLILLLRGSLLPGSGDGIRYYITPDWKTLLTPNIWLQASQQIFWSLAPAWGITITLASHNSFDHKIYRDAILLPIVSGLTSFFGGFVTFSYAGFMAYQMNSTVSETLKPGPGLAFVIYPQALNQLPPPQLWAVLFFLLLLLLGLDSAFTSFDTFYTSLVDEYPNFFLKRKWLSKAVFCIISILLGLTMTTNGGYYVYMLLDWYQIQFFMLVALLEVVVVAHLYGTNRLKENIRLMCDNVIPEIWAFWLKFVLPTMLFLMFITTMVDHESASYGKYKYPTFSLVIGWLIAVANVLPIPVYFGYKIFSAWKGGQPIMPLFRPTDYWEHEMKYIREKKNMQEIEQKEQNYRLEKMKEEGEALIQ